MTATLNSRPYGTLPSGEPVEAWTLIGAGGLVLEVITYGGIITRLLAPDREGKLDDVVLGFKSLDGYLAGHPYFGAIVGRVAGRITNAEFTLDGKLYKLLRNDGPNHLHGGAIGFDKKIWKAVPANRSVGAPALRLTYRSPDGEEGYPGTLDVAVTYTVTGDNTVLIETDGASDRATPFNITNHSYFNLAGEPAGSIDDHELEIYADTYVPTDEHLTLSGRIESLDGRDNDFRRARRMKDALPLLFKNHGDVYPLRKRVENDGQPVLAARVFHPGSGRIMTASTTETHLQFYAGSGLDGSIIGKSGDPYRRHAAFCLECEGYSDAVNAPHMGNIILSPGKPRRNITAYNFSA